MTLQDLIDWHYNEGSKASVPDKRKFHGKAMGLLEVVNKNLSSWRMLRRAYFEDKLTDEELRNTAIELTEEWIRIEVARKATSRTRR